MRGQLSRGKKAILAVVLIINTVSWLHSMSTVKSVWFDSGLFIDPAEWRMKPIGFVISRRWFDILIILFDITILSNDGFYFFFRISVIFYFFSIPIWKKSPLFNQYANPVYLSKALIQHKWSLFRYPVK